VAGMGLQLIGSGDADVVEALDSRSRLDKSRRGAGCRKRQAGAGALEACWGIDG
jgi:hypothetical protein